jgi:hypothetical protein
MIFQHHTGDQFKDTEHGRSRSHGVGCARLLMYVYTCPARRFNNGFIRPYQRSSALTQVTHENISGNPLHYRYVLASLHDIAAMYGGTRSVDGAI